MTFNTNLPLNNLSFGSVSIALLREMYHRKLSPTLFPIGPVDLSAQKPDQDFNNWLSGCINSAQQRHSRKNASVRLWHVQGSLESFSERGNNLLTFFELDSLTPCEINILRQQNKVYVTSNYTKTVFEMFGIKAEYVPLGFDSYNFYQLEKRPSIDKVTQFFCGGKFEKRKSIPQVLRAWAKRYGNNPAYRLNCAVFNPFLGRTPEEAWNNMLNLARQALGGQQVWNINFLPWAETNAIYNTTLQSSEIVISMSGGEGRDLCCYQATALGAWPVAMKAHAFLDYLNDDNAILVNPNGKQPAADGVHFAPNGQFNVGNIFSFSDEEFIAGCEEAEKRVKTLGINKKGLELQKQTYAPAVDILLRDIQ